MSDGENQSPRRSRLAHRLLEVKAGAFVVLLLVIGLGMVTILSEKRHMFEHEVVLHASFEEIQGLKTGAPVRVAGVDVGSVSHIDFINRDGKPLVQVDLKITRDRCSQVRGDSVARIDAQGLLGDKLIEITAGSQSQPALGEGATLKSTPPADLDKMLRQAGETLERVKKVADEAALALDAIADPQMVADVHASMSSLRTLMAATEKGTGLAHAIFYDRRTAQDFSALATHLQELTSHVDTGVVKIDEILRATDNHGRQLVNNLSSAAKNIGDTLGEIRRTQLVHNVDRAAGDLAYLMDYTRAGKGSIGGALIDPMAYERLISILGGVNRSRTLRALVRFALSQDDEKSAAHVAAAPPMKR